jgi:hypothetical protein
LFKYRRKFAATETWFEGVPAFNLAALAAKNYAKERIQ